MHDATLVLGSGHGTVELVAAPEYLIVAVIALPLWIGGLVLWWVTMKQRRTTTPADPHTSAPPGWHPDPLARYELRFWDGQRWTEHVSRGGVAAEDPLG
jgi:hypothetical protein